MRIQPKTGKLISTGFVLLLDLLVLPSVLLLPSYLKNDPAVALNLWLSEFNPIQAWRILFNELFLFKAWGGLQLVVLSLCIYILWINKPKKKRKFHFAGPPAAGNGEFGTSRFQTEDETDKTLAVWKLAEEQDSGGIVLGTNHKTKFTTAWVDREDKMTMVIGTTGSGKTRRLVYPTIWNLSFAEESMLMTDPKGEIYARTSPYLRKKGYNIKVIDFRKPGWGNFWNAMDSVNKAVENDDITEASKQAWSIANMFVYQKPGNSGGESIWKDGAESVIAALILVVAMEAEHENQRHMYSVYKVLAELGRVQTIEMGNMSKEIVPLNIYMDKLPNDHPAKDAYATAALAPERTRGSFFSNVASLLRLVADPSISYLMSKQDHRLDGIGKRKTAVYLIIPDEDKTRHPLAALYIDQTYRALVEAANNNGGRLKVRTNMLFDEFGNMPPLKDFDTKLTVSRSRGIRWTIFLQDNAQLDTAYSKEVANTIRGNCQNLIYLLTTDEGTAKNISSRCGKYTVASEGSSYNVGKNSVSHGGSSGLTGRDLLTADEILRWPADLALVLRAREFPAALPLPDLSLWPADQDFVEDSEEVTRTIRKVNFFIPSINGSQPTNHSREPEPAGASFMSEID